MLVQTDSTTKYKTCTICGEKKKEKEFYCQRRQCIPCYNKRQKEKTANNVDLHNITVRLEARLERMDEKMEIMLDILNRLSVKTETPHDRI